MSSNKAQTERQRQLNDQETEEKRLLARFRERADVKRDGFSFHGCLFIKFLSDYMIPLRVLPKERGVYPSVKEKVIASAMTFFHYATVETYNSNFHIPSLLKNRDLDVVALAALCLAIAIDANRHYNGKVNTAYCNQSTFRSFMKDMWCKVFPDRVEKCPRPDPYWWTDVMAKVPKQLQSIGHAGEHLEFVLSKPFFRTRGIDNDDPKQTDKLRRISKAIIHDWYYCPMLRCPNFHWEPLKIAISAVFLCRVIISGKIAINMTLLERYKLSHELLKEWANKVLDFYYTFSSIAMPNVSRAGWTVTRGRDRSKRVKHIEFG